jgi:hypothetical protein
MKSWSRVDPWATRCPKFRDVNISWFNVALRGTPKTLDCVCGKPQVSDCTGVTGRTQARGMCAAVCTPLYKYAGVHHLQICKILPDATCAAQISLRLIKRF